MGRKEKGPSAAISSRAKACFLNPSGLRSSNMKHEQETGARNGEQIHVSCLSLMLGEGRLEGFKKLEAAFRKSFKCNAAAGLSRKESGRRRRTEVCPAERRLGSRLQCPWDTSTLFDIGKSVFVKNVRYYIIEIIIIRRSTHPQLT